jgi:hypothetical protein
MATNALGGVTARTRKRARLLAERLAAEGDRPGDEPRRLLHDRPSEVLNHVATLLALAVLVLMFWPPGS